jgi:undecaprenyl-diphosphatase
VATATAVASTALDDRPAGERYYRHPGDILRLIVWSLTTVLLILFVQVATQTSHGLTVDLGQAAARVATAARELILALTQVLVVVAAATIVGLLVVLRRWRRLGIVLLAGAAGYGLVALLDGLLDLAGRLPDAVSSGTWLASTRFPNLGVLGAAAAIAAVGKPWLSRAWSRATNLALAALLLVMGLAGTAGAPELLLALAAGTALGALILAVFGSPNRRPSPAAVAAALRDAGLDVATLELQRAIGGRSQLYRATTSSGANVFVKPTPRLARTERRLAVTFARRRRPPRGVPPAAE